MNEFGEIPAKQEEGEKRKMGKEETRSAVKERGATALTIRGRAWPFWGWGGFGRQGGGGPVGLDFSGREKYADG